MGVESDNVLEGDLFTCPFITKCELPKHYLICNISGCKTCSEYILKSNKLKEHRILY
ncbi:MAG: hypothetical protein ACFFFT_00200 [Candidatus Thorarchaeota archaeon]